MWIKTSDRLPDTARKVFIRGTDRKDKNERVVVSCWWDFDQRWANYILFDNEYHTPEFESIAYWCEITDLLELPIEGEQADDSKIDVPIVELSEPLWLITQKNYARGKSVPVTKGLIPVGCSVIEMLDWALETTLESIVYAESKIKWDAAQDKDTDEAIKWLEKCTKTYQRLFAAWERRTNENPSNH